MAHKLYVMSLSCSIFLLRVYDVMDPKRLEVTIWSIIIFGWTTVVAAAAFNV